MKKILFAGLLVIFAVFLIATKTPDITTNGIPTLNGAGKVSQTALEADNASTLDSLDSSDFVNLTGDQTLTGTKTFQNTVTFDNSTVIENDTGSITIGGSLNVLGTCTGCGSASDTGNINFLGSIIYQSEPVAMEIFQNSNNKDLILKGIKNDVESNFVTFTHDIYGLSLGISAMILYPEMFIVQPGANDWNYTQKWDGEGYYNFEMNKDALGGGAYTMQRTGDITQFAFRGIESDDVKAYFYVDVNSNNDVGTMYMGESGTLIVGSPEVARVESDTFICKANKCQANNNSDPIDGKEFVVKDWIENRSVSQLIFGASNGKFKYGSANNNSVGSVIWDASEIETFISKMLLNSTDQDIDVVYAFHIPEDFQGWNGSGSDTIISFSGKVSDTDNSKLEIVAIFDSTGAELTPASEISTVSTTFAALNVPYSDLSAGTFTAGLKFVVVLRCTGDAEDYCSVDDELAKAKILVNLQ